MTEQRLMILAVVLITCASSLLAQSRAQSLLGGSTSDVRVIQLKVQGGTFLVPVLINGQITLNFTIDVLITLARTGTVQKSDFIGKEKLHLANGSIVPSTTFLIRSLKVGHYLLENVKASVVYTKGNLLLGQSFLSRFDSWSIDNKRQVLLLNPKTQQQQVQQSCTARIPTTVQHATGLVTGFLTDEQVLATTRSVEVQLGEKVNPDYLHLKHVVVREIGKTAVLRRWPQFRSICL